MTVSDSPLQDDPQGTSPLKAALVAALDGDPFEVGRHREVLELFIRELAPLLREDTFQNYIRDCNDLFQRAKELDWERILAEWDHLQVLEMLSSNRPGVTYCMPFVDGTYFPLVPGATLGDNRLAILLGLAVLFPDDPLDSVAYLAVVIRGREAATLELQRRFAKLGPWADSLLSVLAYDEPWASKELRRLLTEVMPQDSWRLGGGFSLFGSTGDASSAKWRSGWRGEVTSSVGYHLGLLLVELGKKPLKDVIVEMLNRRFEYLKRDIRQRLIDDLRREHSKRRRPKHDGKRRSGDPLEGLGEGYSGVTLGAEEAVSQPGVLDRLAEFSLEELEERIEKASDDLAAAGCGNRASAILLRFIRSPGAVSRKGLAKELGVSERQLRYDIGKIRGRSGIVLRIIFGDG